MKISLLIPAIVLYTVRVVFSNSAQVGTVLFTATDLVRKCWTDYDRSLLKARAAMQDVLPGPDYLDLSNPQTLRFLLDYFHSCYRIVNNSTYGKVQNLMHAALSDAFGGYLRAHALPFTKKCYYAGLVKYSEAQKLFMLYDDIKAFLKTDGRGWATPPKSRFRMLPNTKPLPIIHAGSEEACEELYIIEKDRKPHTMTTVERLPSPVEYHEDIGDNDSNNRAGEEGLQDYEEGNSTSSGIFSECNDTSVEEFDEYSNGTENGLEDSQSEENYTSVVEEPQESHAFKTVVVPLPVLDDEASPNSIAVPFKKRPFQSLKSGSSANILVRYYTSVIRCFIEKGNTRTDIKDFNGRLYAWLISKVVPHLGDEQWYPGFGGVLRVMETIKTLDAGNGVGKPDPNDYGFLFDEGAAFDVDPAFKTSGSHDGADLYETQRSVLQRYFFLGALALCVLMSFLSCLIFFLRRPQRSPKISHDGEDGASQNEILVNFNFVTNFLKPKTKRVDLSQKAQEKALPKTELLCAGDQFTGPAPQQGQNIWAHGDIQDYCARNQPEYFITHARLETRRTHNVHTLWKKPSNLLNRYWTSGYEMEEESRKDNSLTVSEAPGSTSSNFEDETRCYSTELRTLCNCTGSCHCTGPTDSSSITKTKQNKSGPTGIFDGYDEVNPKGNTSTKSSTQCSETESGSEGFCSSDVSTSLKSVLRKHRNSKNYP